MAQAGAVVAGVVSFEPVDMSDQAGDPIAYLPVDYGPGKLGMETPPDDAGGAGGEGARGQSR